MKYIRRFARGRELRIGKDRWGTWSLFYIDRLKGTEGFIDHFPVLWQAKDYGDAFAEYNGWVPTDIDWRRVR